MRDRREGRGYVLARVWVDALTYAIVVALLATLLALLLGVVTGGGFVRGKRLLFVFGWVAMAYATFKLWPTSPEDIEESGALNRGASLPERQTATRFQGWINELPPRRWTHEPRPHRRISIYGKIFIASILMLLFSYLLEAQFGVT